MISGVSDFETNPSHLTGYGMKAGHLTHISDVSRGLACQCKCVVCHKALIAKKGVKRCHHFAHQTESNCQGAAESALHLLSKELILEMSWMELPPYFFVKERKRKTGRLVSHNQRVAKGGRVMISSVTLESRKKGFIADSLLSCGEKQLIVEIAVTHKVDRQKLRHIRRSDIPAIEIQLHVRDALLSRENLRELIQNEPRIKRWLFHPKQRDAERSFIEKFRGTRSKKLPPLIPGKARPSQRKTSALNLSNAELNICDRLAEEFNKKYKRYPRMDECLRLWPKYWKKGVSRDLQ